MCRVNQTLPFRTEAWSEFVQAWRATDGGPPLLVPDVRVSRADPSAAPRKEIVTQAPGTSWCYSGLQSIPGGVDGVVIITQPEITKRIVHDCTGAGVRRVWMHQSFGKRSSVSPEAVEYCRQHDISVIAGACPMMYRAGADVGHTCMRWILRFTGGLPT